MRAVIIDAPSEVRVAEVEPRTPAPGEVRIQVSLVGICATDVHILHGTFPTASYPITPGHEVTGRVVEVADDVRSVAVGDTVVVDPGLPDMTCRLCREGRFNLCENRNAIGITLTGGAAEFVTVPAMNCHLVLEGTPAGSEILAEPLACVVHAFDLVRSAEGEDVLIYGAGTIGLLAAIVARSRGAKSVSVVELDVDRGAKAEAVGAFAATDASSFGRDDWGLVVDATGAAPAIMDGLSRLRRGGSLLQIGVARPDATIDVKPYQLFQRELTMVGSLTTRNSFPRSLALLASGAVDHHLITGEPFGLDEYPEAIASAGRGQTLKVTVAP
jgi:2-desacetyl-2-hydroxyethyl bacteriochlorophyllide A dehydrogenase